MVKTNQRDAKHRPSLKDHRTEQTTERNLSLVLGISLNCSLDRPPLSKYCCLKIELRKLIGKSQRAKITLQHVFVKRLILMPGTADSCL
jgi:hypothetical protein